MIMFYNRLFLCTDALLGRVCSLPIFSVREKEDHGGVPEGGGCVPHRGGHRTDEQQGSCSADGGLRRKDRSEKVAAQTSGYNFPNFWDLFKCMDFFSVILLISLLIHIYKKRSQCDIRKEDNNYYSNNNIGENGTNLI